MLARTAEHLAAARIDLDKSAGGRVAHEDPLAHRIEHGAEARLALAQLRGLEILARAQRLGLDEAGAEHIDGLCHGAELVAAPNRGDGGGEVAGRETLHGPGHGLQRQRDVARQRDTHSGARGDQQQQRGHLQGACHAHKAHRLSGSVNAGARVEDDGVGELRGGGLVVLPAGGKGLRLLRSVAEARGEEALAVGAVSGPGAIELAHELLVVAAVRDVGLAVGARPVKALGGRVQHRGRGGDLALAAGERQHRLGETVFAHRGTQLSEGACARHPVVARGNGARLNGRHAIQGQHADREHDQQQCPEARADLRQGAGSVGDAAVRPCTAFIAAGRDLRPDSRHLCGKYVHLAA